MTGYGDYGGFSGDGDSGYGGDGGGGGSGGGSQGMGSPSKSTPRKTTISRVNVLMIQNGTKDGNTMTIDNQDLGAEGLVHVVGRISGEDTSKMKKNKRVFFLQDGSGMCEIHHFSQSGNVDWRIGACYSVIGNCDKLPTGMVKIVVKSFDQVVNYNRITDHHLLVIQEHLYNNYGTLSNKFPDENNTRRNSNQGTGGATQGGRGQQFSNYSPQNQSYRAPPRRQSGGGNYNNYGNNNNQGGGRGYNNSRNSNYNSIDGGGGGHYDEYSGSGSNY